MGDTVITVENLCKKYTISHQKQARYETFRDDLNYLRAAMNIMEWSTVPGISLLGPQKGNIGENNVYIWSDEIIIVAIMHQKQKLAYWFDRL